VKKIFQVFLAFFTCQFSGTLTTNVKYTISTPHEISWEISATTDKVTIANITNHGYWNMESLDSSILNQEFTLKSTKFMPVDTDCLVTGEVINLKDTKIGNA
jgi:aldose 1-epimerase